MILALILHNENVCRYIIILSECEGEMQNDLKIIPTSHSELLDFRFILFFLPAFSFLPFIFISLLFVVAPETF
jgi:hypothetical protein